ncbi:hypothetical protein H0H93_004618 [Arthromyces matolae]|nr:hypothetical protein H0H93_004618 [Arthromyces matolae]
MPYKRPQDYSGYDWESRSAYSDSTTHYSDFTSKSPQTSKNDLPVRREDGFDATVIDESCLISNGMDGVRRFYLMPHDMDHYTLSKLEHGVGLPWGCINVKSLLNSVYLSSDFYDAFDQGFLILVPERRITDLLLANPCVPIVKLLKDRTYNYTLLSTGKVRTIRRHLVVDGNVVVEEYQHPFLNFPQIISQIHPFFVIWNVMQRLTLFRLGKYYRAYPMERSGPYQLLLSRALQCASLWTRTSPPRAFYTALRASPTEQANLDALISYRADSGSFEHALAHALKGDDCLDPQNMQQFLGEKHRRRTRKRRERFVKEWVHIFSRTTFEPMPKDVIDGEDGEPPTKRSKKAEPSPC